MSNLRTQILQTIASFCAETGISERSLGVLAVRDSHLVRRLRLGHGTQLSTLERLESWMSAEMERRSSGMAEAA